MTKIKIPYKSEYQYNMYIGYNHAIKRPNSTRKISNPITSQNEFNLVRYINTNINIQNTNITTNSKNTFIIHCHLKYVILSKKQYTNFTQCFT